MKSKMVNGVIYCSRNSGASREEMSEALERLDVPPEPMTAISCGIGNHEDCPGEGCECLCHKS